MLHGYIERMFTFWQGKFPDAWWAVVKRGKERNVATVDTTWTNQQARIHGLLFINLCADGYVLGNTGAADNSVDPILEVAIDEALV